MKLKELLAKLAAGEALTEAEKAFLKDFDPDAESNNVAAAARRKAEERLQTADQKVKDLEAKVKELADSEESRQMAGKTELEKLQKQVERLTAQLAERDGVIQNLSKEKDGLTREQKLAALLQRAGIQFVPGVNPTAMTRLFREEFSGMDTKDLDDKTLTDPIIEAFKTGNAAIIADTTGHGAGGDPSKRSPVFQGQSISNPWKKDSMNLTLQGRIAAADPELAKRLRREAGLPA